MSEENKVISLGYSPRPIQAYLHQTIRQRKIRFFVAVCHRRFGKTKFALGELATAGFECEHHNPQYAYIAPTYGQAERIAWTYLKEMFKDFPGIEKNEQKLRLKVPRHNKGDYITIWLLGAENPDSIRGIYLDGVVFDEYAQMSPSIWGEVVRPLLSDRRGWAVFIGTPKGMNQFYQMYQTGQLNMVKNPHLNWFAFSAPASKTKIIDPDELKALRLEMSEEEYSQEFECFPAGTLIATSNGNIPIEDIRKNDFVITHTNRMRPVTRTMNRATVEELYEINSFGSQEALKTTAEHPFYVYTKNTASYTWVKAKDLKVGDFLVTPKVNKLPKVINESYARILAWYIAEGSINGNSVQFSLNPHNEKEISDVHNLMTFEGYKVKEYAKGCLVVCSTSLCDLLSSHGGCLAENKSIPFSIIGGHEQMFFETLMRGDGCIVKFKGGKGYKYTTISRSLAYDVQLLASKLGRRSSIVVRPAHIGEIQGRVVNCAESYLLNISFGLKVNHKNPRQIFPTKLGIATEIREIRTTPFNGTVYNLSVKEDESYIANNKVVHNCSFQAALIGAYYGKYIIEAEEQGRICDLPHNPQYQVNTYWDIGVDDSTAIWFSQTIGDWEHVIDYYEMSGMGLEHFAQVLKEKGYSYGEHWFPHDGAVTEWGTGNTRVQTAHKLLGIRPRVAKKGQVADGINAVRMLLKRCKFDKIKCMRGLDALKNYERKWDDKNGIFQEKPLHNWASHGSDAFRTKATCSKTQSSVSLKSLPRQAETKFNPWSR